MDKRNKQFIKLIREINNYDFINLEQIQQLQNHLEQLKDEINDSSIEFKIGDVVGTFGNSDRDIYLVSGYGYSFDRSPWNNITKGVSYILTTLAYKRSRDFYYLEDLSNVEEIEGKQQHWRVNSDGLRKVQTGDVVDWLTSNNNEARKAAKMICELINKGVKND